MMIADVEILDWDGPYFNWQTSFVT